MVVLRNAFGVNTTDDTARLTAEQASADGMGSLRRGYNAGRIGTDVNAALDDEASYRAQGREQEAAAAAQRAADLQRRQAMYAPDVGRVEDIKGLGDALSWAGTQMGQGAASMQDPALIAAGGQAVGTVSRFIPGLRGVSNLAPLAGAIGAFGYNQRQNAGEMYGRLKDDPAAMANMTAQEARNTTNLYGLGAGALDTVVPALAGRALGGRALLRDNAAGKAVLGNAGPMGRTGLGMLAEGTTELGQQGLQQFTHSSVNPDRDTAGDFSENLNAFAGGAVGGAPFSAAGAYADTGYERVGTGAERVREVAGQVVDMAAERGGQIAGQVADRMREVAPDVYQRSGLKGVIDLGTEKGKSAWQTVAEGYRKVDTYVRDAEGRVNFPKAMDRARQDVERYRLSEDDYSVFTEMPDDNLKGPELESWYVQTDQRRMNLAAQRLEALEEQGVPEATELLDRITNQDPVVAGAAIPDAVEFLLSRNESALVREKAVIHRAMFGTAIQKATAAVTSGARKGAEAAVKGAAFVAENIVEGVRQAGSKKNMQGVFAQPAERIRPQDTAADFDKWAKWTMQNETGNAVAAAAARWDPKASAQVPGVTAQRKRQPVPPQVKERAVAHGEMLAAEIERTMTEIDAELGLPDYARTLAYEINRTAFEAGTNPVSQTRMDRMVEDLVGLFGSDATQIVNRMAQTSSPALRPFFQQINDRVTGWSAGRAQRRMRDRVMTDQLIALLPVEQQREVRSEPKAGADLLNMVGELTRGRVPPARRKQLEQALGAETVGRMLEVYNAETESLNADGVSLDIAQELGTMVDDTAMGREVAGDDVVMNDDGEVTGMTMGRADTFDQRQAERKLSRNSGPRMYVFVGEGKQSVRSSDDGSTRKARNPFEPNKKMSPAGAAEARAAAVEMSLLTGDNKPVIPNARPRLIRGDEDGADVKLANKVAELEKTLGVDRTPENFFRLAQKELKGPAMAKQRAALERLQQAHAAGDPAAAARVEESMKRFFMDRAGEYVVNAVTAKQVMDELGMSPSQRMAIFRDYMFQTATRMQAKDREAAAKYRTLAQNANMMLLDGVQEVDTARAENADTPTSSGMQGARQQRRLTAGEARTVRRAMEKYFSEGYLVRAEQLSDRTPGTMAVGELLELARAGTNMREAARGRAAKSGAVDGAVGDSLRNEIEGQLLNFPQRQGVNLLGTKGENNDLAIPTHNLVAWVRANRREDAETDTGGFKASEEKLFLADLMEGISTLASMDLIGGLPYVVGPKGDKQPFTNSVMERLDARTLESTKQLEGMGLPPALALPNRTGWSANASKRERVETAREAAKSPDGSAVSAAAKEAARDAELAKTPDWFVADPLESLEDNVTIRTDRLPGDLAVGEFADRPLSVPRSRTVGEGRTTRAGERMAAAPRVKTADIDSDDVAPLDTALGRSQGDAEFEDQKRRSVDLTKGKPRESSIDAVKMAEQRGAQVVAYKNQTEVRDGQDRLQRVDREIDVAKTIANVESRLKAARGEGKDAGMAAGKHYAYPLAHALSVRNLQDLLDSGAFDADQQQRLIDAQMEVAAILSQEGAGRVPAGPRLRLAKALADGFAEVKDYAEADALLKRLGAQSPVKPKAKAQAAPKADAAPAGTFTNKQVAMAIADEDYSAIKTDDDADAFISAMVRTRKQLDAMARQYERDGKDMAPGPVRARTRLAEILDGKGKFAEFDLASLYPSWKMDSEPFADRIQKALRNTAAPEVAAQGPKSQPSPAGVTLTGSSPYLAKDQRKADQATKFIGRGSGRSSTGQYAQDFGALANSGTYTSQDTVFVSAEGARTGRYDPDFKELGKAADAGVTFITDTPADRAREYNVGERQVAEFLTERGYKEVSPGRWRQALNFGAAGLTPGERGFMRGLLSVVREVTSTGDVERFRMGMIMLREQAETMADDTSTPDEVAAARHFTNIADSVEKALVAAASTQDDNNQIMGRLAEGEQPLKLLVDEGTMELNAVQRAVAKAIAKVAGDTKVRSAPGGSYFDDSGSGIVLGFDQRKVAATVLLHEGVHAATVEAMHRDPSLRYMVTLLMRNIRAQDPGMALEYGMSNEYEFVAEAMSNPSFQARLRGLKASGAVTKALEKYTVWDSFVALVKKALGVDISDTALEQALTVGAVIMREQGTRKLNAQATTGQPANDAQIAQAKAYLDRVLGKQIKAEFAEITGYSGEWIESDNLLRVSTLTNAGIMDVARHEALHAFFSKFVKANPKAAKVFASLTDDPRIVKRLEILLKDEPEALKQLTDGEERLAYIYQFAMAGRLRLPSSQGKTLLGKIRKFLRHVFQMVSDQERAADLLYAFEAGKMRDPSAAGKAIAATINRGAWATRGALAFDKVAQKAAALIQPASEILAKSASPTARKIGELFYTNPGEAKDGERAAGYLNDRNQNMRRFENVYREVIDGLNPEQAEELITAMQRETPTDEISDPEVAQTKEKLHKFFERMYRYMKDEKGLRIKKIEQNYFPRVYDTDKLMNDPSKFTGMLLGKYRPQLESMADSWNDAQDAYYAEMGPDAAAKAPPKVEYTPEAVAEALTSRLIGADGVDDSVLDNPLREDGVLRPWMSAGEKRKLAFISPEDIEPFLEKDLTLTLSRYVRQAVRTAEYSARFGRQGAVLHRMLMQAEKELISKSHDMLKDGDLKDEKARANWVRRQFRDVSNATGAMEGSLGNDIKPIVRQLNSWGVVYQNVRLLPLALFSSFVDPLGIIARGGEMRHAYNAFVRGIKGVGQQWADMIRDEPSGRKKDHWERLAEIAGVVDSATFSHLLADEYGSVYHTGTTRKINEVMFKANGMEAWNRAMRVGATEAAVNFITRHAKGETKDSARWMRELGLSAVDLHYTAEGDLITDKRVLMSEKPDMSLEEAELAVAKLHSSILRWAEGAVLSPNAAQRPAWASDPNYGVFWHLKQFAYSFHETIMRRAVNEAKQGNAMPLGVFAWYIPVMIASDVIKGLATGMGDLPNYMQGYDVGDWVQHGVDRSGVLGKYHLLIDGIQDPMGVPGPMFDQVIDIITEPVEKTFIDALPAHAVYERMI